MPDPAKKAEQAELIEKKDEPKVIEKQLEQVKEGEHEFKVHQDVPVAGHRFHPDKGLPVWINYTDPRDPFELYEEVSYTNGPIKVVIPAGFKCDATSTPAAVFLTPAVFQILAAVWWAMAWSPNVMVALWALGTLLAIFVPWTMPGVGQLGLHARSAVVHDALYKTQPVSRVVSDAVMWEIMQYDRVHFLPKWMIYTLLRAFGGRAWRRNAARLEAVAKGEKEPPPGPEPISEIAPEKKP